MIVFQRTLAIVLLFLLTACASGSHSSNTQLASVPEASDFTLDVFDTTYISDGKAAAFTLKVEPAGDELTVRVLASDADQLKALAFSLDYDPARLRIQHAAGLNAFAEGKALALAAHSGTCAKLSPGRAECCFMLIDLKHAAGFSGSGAVAELRFALGRETQHAASSTPGFDDFVRDLTLSSDGGRLSWTYRNTGDYDLNGETSGADLVPIALHYLANSSSTDWEAARFADGDGNGEVNQADIVPIAQNYRGTIVGYQVWGGNGVAGEWTHFGNATLETNLRTDASRPYFSVDVSSAGYTHYMLWPYDGSDDEGLWSNIAYAGNDPRRVFLNFIAR